MRFRQDKAAVRRLSRGNGGHGFTSGKSGRSIQMIQDRDNVIERLFIGVNFPDGMNRFRDEILFTADFHFALLAVGYFADGAVVGIRAAQRSPVAAYLCYGNALS